MREEKKKQQKIKLHWPLLIYCQTIFTTQCKQNRCDWKFVELCYATKRIIYLPSLCDQWAVHWQQRDMSLSWNEEIRRQTRERKKKTACVWEIERTRKRKWKKYACQIVEKWYCSGRMMTSVSVNCFAEHCLSVEWHRGGEFKREKKTVSWCLFESTYSQSHCIVTSNLFHNFFFQIA